MENLDSKKIAEKFNLAEFMTLSELCSFFKCSERFIHNEIKRKNLRAYKPVRDLLFDPKDIQAWIKRKVKVENG